MERIQGGVTGWKPTVASGGGPDGAPLHPDPSGGLESPVTDRRSPRLQKGLHQRQQSREGAEEDRRLTVRGEEETGPAAATGKTPAAADEPKEEAGTCSLLSMFGGGTKPSGRRGRAAPATRGKAAVAAGDSAPTTKEAGGRDEEEEQEQEEGGQEVVVSEDLDSDGGAVDDRSSRSGGAGGGASSSLDWRVSAAEGKKRQRAGSPSAHSGACTSSSSSSSSSSRGAEPRDESASAAAAAAAAEAAATTRTGREAPPPSSVGGPVAGVGTPTRTSKRSTRSATCSSGKKRHPLPEQQPPEAEVAREAPMASSSVSSSVGAASGADPESGGGVVDICAGEGAPSLSAAADRSDDGGVVDDVPIPCMLLLDSTRGHRSQEMFKMVRKYVEAAWNNTHGTASAVGEVEVTAKLLGGCSPPIPQQTNDCDCGVYVLHYAKLVLENPPLVTQRFLDKKGRGGMFNKNWFDKRVISDTRKNIRGTVESLRWDCVEQERAAGTTNAAAATATAAAAGRATRARGV
ncbi:unnamed protein product [Pylaiella littoralis]